MATFADVAGEVAETLGDYIQVVMVSGVLVHATGDRYLTLLSSSSGPSKSMMTFFSVAPISHGHGGGCGVRS